MSFLTSASSTSPLPTTNSTSSATSTGTPYYQPPPDPTHLSPATYLVVPILGLSGALIAAVWYFVHQRKKKQKEKKRSKRNNAMMFAQTEASRQKMRDMEREQGDQDDSTAKNGVEVIGETSSAADRG